MKFLYKHQEDTYVFELSNGIAVQLVYLDPPFNSSLRLIKEGTKLFGISLKNDGSSSSTVEKISRYHFTTEKDLTTSDESFDRVEFTKIRRESARGNPTNQR